MSPEILWSVGSTIVGAATTIAVQRVQIANLQKQVEEIKEDVRTRVGELRDELRDKLAPLEGIPAKVSALFERVQRLESKNDALDKDYVPRNEIQSWLHSMDKAMADLKGLVQLLIYSGRSAPPVVNNVTNPTTHG